MTRTATRTSRPELLALDECACGPARCSLTGPCLEAALADERFGLTPARRRQDLRLAS
ncbi:hypothetical protein [Klenkia brasiliensis]|uniref:Transcription factor WhiB n=1 Tax=Klenkia brasiliensis TaxID=333142 RepID=A0A1G7V1N5_9ACTN|nr:hypothetical protein [Klenkia brasiliensis]SDG53634.1 hypothetical protein SAMN05660324_2872 [Klenkia brasiliensis]